MLTNKKCENSKGVIFMSRRGKLTDEERIRAVGEYLEGKGSYRAIAKKYGINRERFRQLVIRAQAEGIESIKISQTQKKYTAEIKIAAVKEYLEGKGSQVEICKKYNITTDSILIQWIKCYNSGKDFICLSASVMIQQRTL